MRLTMREAAPDGTRFEPGAADRLVGDEFPVVDRLGLPDAGLARHVVCHATIVRVLVVEDGTALELELEFPDELMPAFAEVVADIRSAQTLPKVTLGTRVG